LNFTVASLHPCETFVNHIKDHLGDDYENILSLTMRKCAKLNTIDGGGPVTRKEFRIGRSQGNLARTPDVDAALSTKHYEGDWKIGIDAYNAAREGGAHHDAATAGAYSAVGYVLGLGFKV